MRETEFSAACLLCSLHSQKSRLPSSQFFFFICLFTLASSCSYKVKDLTHFLLKIAFLRKRCYLPSSINLSFPTHLGKSNWFLFLHTTTYTSLLLTLWTKRVALFRCSSVLDLILQMFAGGILELSSGSHKKERP